MKVYSLFTVVGDGDGIERFNLESVHKTQEGAGMAALHIMPLFVPEAYPMVKDIIELADDIGMRFIMTRKEYTQKIVSEVLICYGDFGGFVIEESELQE